MAVSPVNGSLSMKRDDDNMQASQSFAEEEAREITEADKLSSLEPSPNIHCEKEIENCPIPRSPKTVKCDECTSSFASKKSLNRHKKLHTGLLQCDVCGASFYERSRLSLHKKCHTDPFICHTCGKQFISREGLNYHVKDHQDSPSNKYKCNTCNMTFRQKTYFLGHQNSCHLQHRPYRCEVCGKEFAYRSNMQRHSKERCMKSSPFPCEDCETVTNSKRALEEHIKAKHCKEQFRCQCGKLFSWKRSFNRHVKSCKNLLE